MAYLPKSIGSTLWATFVLTGFLAIFMIVTWLYEGDITLTQSGESGAPSVGWSPGSAPSAPALAVSSGVTPEPQPAAPQKETGPHIYAEQRYPAPETRNFLAARKPGEGSNTSPFSPGDTLSAASYGEMKTAPPANETQDQSAGARSQAGAVEAQIKPVVKERASAGSLIRALASQGHQVHASVSGDEQTATLTVSGATLTRDAGVRWLGNKRTREELKTAGIRIVVIINGSESWSFML